MVDCLIAFHSRGYPLEKVIFIITTYSLYQVTKYVELTDPVVINDLQSQFILRSRLEVFDRLDAAGIPTPRHIRVDHKAVMAKKAEFDEFDDYFIYNGVRLDKPFIEKPEDADDHNNYVYYPT